MSTRVPPETTERLAIPASEVAKLLGISQRHLWNLSTTGRLPRPDRLGRSVRWNRAELEAWLAAGGPTRDKWERIKASSESR